MQTLAVRPISGPLLDASTPISAATARAMRAAGKLGLMRCCDFPNERWAEPARPEIDGLLSAGLGVSLYFMWRSAYSAELGRSDALRRHALIESLGLPLDTPTCVDFESRDSHSAADVEAYARAHVATFRELGRTNQGAYWANSVARSGANLAGLFDWWCESGERPIGAKWVPAKYEMKQHPNPPGTTAVFVAGHPVDLNDGYGAPMLVDTAAWVEPVAIEKQGTMSKHDNRAIVPNETEADRYCRQIVWVCEGGHTTTRLERGTSTSQSTCMVVARSADRETRLLPEDGDKVWTEVLPFKRRNGTNYVVDWGDYGKEVAEGDNLIDVGITYPAMKYGAWCGQSDPAYRDGPKRGCVYWIHYPGVGNSEHVVSCLRVTILATDKDGKPTKLQLETVQGGQYPAPHVRRYTDTILVWDGTMWRAGTKDGKTVKGWAVRSESVLCGDGKWPYPDSRVDVPIAEPTPPPAAPELEPSPLPQATPEEPVAVTPPPDEAKPVEPVKAGPLGPLLGAIVVLGGFIAAVIVDRC